MAETETEIEHRIHLRIAEQGKLHALQGDFARAMGCYRIAMRLTVEAEDPEAFFRHYLECLVEALEQDGSLDAVLKYCDEVEALQKRSGLSNELMRYDWAVLQQRRGVVHLKLGNREAAETALAEACRVAGELDAELPLADTLLRWCRARLHIDTRRLQEEQQSHGYFSVRAETVRPDIATTLSDSEIFGPMAMPQNR
ncbi:MAG: hypothetical protein JJU20_13095 [Opitutales bacterium]|nr:hypothetical protein [Opitutales bacterium]